MMKFKIGKLRVGMGSIVWGLKGIHLAKAPVRLELLSVLQVS
jgi:hypothetical protein